MQDICVNPREPNEVVYCPEMKDAEINARFKAQDDRIDALKRDSKQTTGHVGVVPVIPPTENWFKRNASWFFPCVTLLVGSVAVVSFFGNLVDHRIADKLKDPVKGL